MDSAQILIAVIVGIAGCSILLPVLLKYPFLAVILPWILPITKLYLMVHVPVTQVVDITLFSFIFLAFFLLVGFAFGRLQWDSKLAILLILHFAFAAILIISYSWTSAPNYGFQKMASFTVFNSICFILGVVTIRKTSDLKRLAQVFSLLVFFVSITMLLNPSYMIGAKWNMRQSFAGTSPLNIAFALGVGAVLSLVWLKTNNYFFKLLTPIICFAAFIATYKTQSRAMIAQIVIGLGIFELIHKSHYRLLRIVGISSIIFIAVVILSFTIMNQDSSIMIQDSRVLGLFRNPGYWIQQSDRPWLWLQAIKGFPKKPLLGHGVGAFAMNVMGNDSRDFPHNFFLEVLYEGGLISLVLFTLFWFVLAVALWRRVHWNNKWASHYNAYLQVVWVAIFVASALASVLHWDISGQRLLWLLAGLALAATRVTCMETAEELHLYEEQEKDWKYEIIGD